MAGTAGSDAGREREELTFLVGTACSRVINLLMQPGSDTRELRDELVFLSERAGRLAELLPAEPGAGTGPGGTHGEESAGPR